MPFYADSPFSIPNETVAVTVDSSGTVSSGGALDWHGRASTITRPDGVVVLAYQRSTDHAVNDGTGIHLRMSSDYGVTWSAEDTNEVGTAITGAPLLPPVAAGQDAGEPWFIYTPNGDLLCFTWRVDYNVDNDGTYIFRSTDGGDTWDGGNGPISWAGLSAVQNTRTYCTDDGFNIDDTMYVFGRVYATDTYTSSAVVMMTSDDDGYTWSRDATIVSASGPPTDGAIELGATRVGASRFHVMIRDTAHTNGYTSFSDDYGVTWDSLTDVSSTAGIVGRPRIYNRAWLKGQANWWNDPVLIGVGFVHQVSGSSQTRRNCVWISRNRGLTWSTPFYIDSSTEDAGYGDIFYRPSTDRWVVVNYQGTLATAALKQYVLDIAGI